MAELNYCQNDNDYFPIRQASTILPYPGHSGQYLIFNDNLANIFMQYFGPNQLLYSIVDMSHDNGEGAVTIKRQVAVDTFLNGGNVIAVRRPNCDGWWVVVAEYGNECYWRVPITSAGVGTALRQCIADNITWSDQLCNAADFSPDGTKYARIGYHNDVVFMDFDGSSGLFANPVKLLPPIDSSFYHSVCFSPNSRYLYVVHNYQIFQYDTEADNIEASMVVAVSIDPSQVNSQLGKGRLSTAKLAPDGKIYISSPGSHLFLSTINAPDSLGTAIDFQLHNIPLPFWNNFGLSNLPHFYNMDITTPCDTLTNVSESDVLSFGIAPNPVHGVLYITSPYSERCDLSIYSINGQLLLSSSVASGKNEIVHDLDDGVYVAFFSHPKGNRQAQKIVIYNE